MFENVITLNLTTLSWRQLLYPPLPPLLLLTYCSLCISLCCVFYWSFPVISDPAIPHLSTSHLPLLKSTSNLIDLILHHKDFFNPHWAIESAVEMYFFRLLSATIFDFRVCFRISWTLDFIILDSITFLWTCHSVVTGIFLPVWCPCHAHVHV